MQNHLKKYLLIFILLFNYSYSQNQSEIELFIFDDTAYLSLEEFCILENYKFNHYPEKVKIEFFVNDNHITFSNNSSFAKINNTIYHMIKNVQLINNKFFVPLNSFVRIYSQIKSDNFIANYNDKTILITPNPIVSYKENHVEKLVDQQLLNTIQNAENWKISTVIIDPGHGGKDPGAIGYHNIKEKHIVLDIAKELGGFLKKAMPTLNIIYTRDNDTFLGLKNRTNLANKNQGHIFLSIHANSSSAKTARGYEIYLLQPNSVDDAIDVALRENASIVFEDNPDQYEQNQMIASLAEKTYLKESEKLAIFIQEALKKELPKTRNRGIKQAGFHVLVGASMPNVLIETGFLSNKKEANQLNKSYYRSKIAEAIFDAIVEFKGIYENE